MNKKFDNEIELIEFSKTALNKNLGELFPNFDFDSLTKNNKGKIGQLMEEKFFGYKLNNKSKPDFEELGIELKIAPIKKNKNLEYNPKERIKITSLNHEDVIKNENIKKSNTWKKMQNILLMFYLHFDQLKLNEFKYIDLFKVENTNYFKQIENDWKKIRNYIKEGKMHNISESNTKFLGLARNGSGRNELKINQPYSEEKYFKRAFTFKTNFVKLILNEIKENKKNDFIEKMKIDLKGKKINDFIEEKYENIKNVPKNINELAISKKYGVNKFSKLSEKIYEEYCDYFTFKTIPLKIKKNGKYSIKESFKLNINILEEIKNEWIDSKFSLAFENYFILILIEHNYNDIKKSKIIDIKKIKFNDNEINAVKFGFEEFKYRYYNGGLLDRNGNLNFIKSTDNNLIHFRPSAKNSNDKFISYSGENCTKTKIWFNNNLILKKIGYI